MPIAYSRVFFGRIVKEPHNFHEPYIFKHRMIIKYSASGEVSHTFLDFSVMLIFNAGWIYIVILYVEWQDMLLCWLYSGL